MEVKLGAQVYYIFSMTTTTTNSLRHFSVKLLLHSLTVPRMEIKLSTNACNIISMRTTLFEQQISSGNFLKNYSSLLKLAKDSTHADETWYTCVLHYFHDN